MRAIPRCHRERAPHWRFGERDLDEHVRRPEPQRHRLFNHDFGVADGVRDKSEDVAIATIDSDLRGFRVDDPVVVKASLGVFTPLGDGIASERTRRENLDCQ